MRISLLDAAKRLQQGEVVAIPTETVYGLAARYDDLSTIQTLYKLKNRPPENPLILHINAKERVREFTDSVPNNFDLLADHFWPGALTLVIPIDEKKILPEVRANLATQAFRVPALAMTRELLALTGPLVAPSANLSGKPSSTSPSHVEEDFGLEFPVLDGGACQKGIESTILIYQDGRWHLGRLGAIAATDFVTLLGYEPKIYKKGESPLCPGQLFKHYSPKAKLYLQPGKDAIVGFSDRRYGEGVRVFKMGSSKNPEEVLENLYRVLRKLDEEGVLEASVDIDVPHEGLFLTYLERIKKASISM